MTKKRSAVAVNSVPVQLEKATEFEKRDPILQVHPEVLDVLKSSQQISDDQEQQALEAKALSQRIYYRNKLYYYGGLFGALVVLWFGVRYFRAPKPSGAVLQEVINAVV